MTSRPTCYECKKPLSIYTWTLYFRDPTKTNRLSPHGNEMFGLPKDKEEAKRLVAAEHPELKVKRVSLFFEKSASVWDGKSYGNVGDSLFCTNTCAEKTGRRVARAVRSKEALTKG